MVRIWCGWFVIITACGGAGRRAAVARDGDSVSEAQLPPVVDESPVGDAGRGLQHALALMDARRYSESIVVLEELRGRLPRSAQVRHVLALAYRLSGQPAQAVELLMPYERILDVAETAALGGAVDELGDPARAEVIIRRGLRRFPYAALLYSEAALIVARTGSLVEAIELLTDGMEVEPAWPTSYLHGATLMSRAGAAGMTLYWGEIFRVLEPESERSAAMALMMINALRTRAQASSGGSNSAAPAMAREVSVMPYVQMLEDTEGRALADAVVGGLSLQGLHSARAAYFQAGPPTPPTELFLWVTELAHAGHLETYDHWLYGPAFPDEARMWFAQHPTAMDRLDRYVRSHPFEPTVSIAPGAEVRSGRRIQ